MGILGICQIPFDTFCIFPFCLLVSLTYWESAAYKKSRDGGLGDFRNPHELAFCVMLHSSSCFLVCITYWESAPYKKLRDGDWDCPMGILGILKSHSAFFYFPFGKYYILGISAL